MTGSTTPSRKRRLPLIGLLSAMLALAGAVAPASAASAVATELEPWTSGRQLLERDRFDEARDWFAARKNARPGDTCGYYFTALVYTNFDLDGLLNSEQVEAGAALIDEGLEIADRSRDPTPGQRYCHGALHGLRAAERLKRSKYLGAAMDARRSRRTMIDLVEDDPDCVDCYFWLGSYDYFADLLPSVVKFFRTLLFFPSGDKQRGLDRLHAAADHGQLDKFSALWTLISLYSGPERDPARALALLEHAQREYPESFNARLERAWFHMDLESPPDRGQGISIHLSLLEESARLDEPQRSVLERRVRLSLAQAYLSDLQPLKALETVDALWPSALEAPESAVDVAATRMRACNRAGKYARAVRTLQALQERYPESPALEGLQRINDAYDARSSRELAATMAPWRMGREGRLAEARTEFERLIAASPLPDIARFALAHLYFELERYEDAGPLFESVGESDLAWPNALRPLAYLRLGQIHDLADDRRSARAAYKTVQKLAREQPGLKSLAQNFLDRPHDGTFRVNFP